MLEQFKQKGKYWINERIEKIRTKIIIIIIIVCERF